jgi:hypothetical protein
MSGAASASALLAQNGVKESFAVFAKTEVVLFRHAACRVSMTKADQAIQREVFLPQFHKVSQYED